MEILVQRNDLAKELQLVQGIVERKNSIPILSNVLAEARAGEIRISATDLDVSLRCGCAAEVVEEGAVTLAAKKLYEIVRSLPESDVRLKLEKRRLGARSSCERVEFRMAGLPREDFPTLPEAEGRRGIEMPARVLRELIQRTAFAITAEDARYYLAGALLVLDKEARRDGGDGRPPARVGRAQGDRSSWPSRARAGAAQGDHGARPADRGGGRRRDRLLPAGRRPPVFGIGGRTLASKQVEAQFPAFEKVIAVTGDKKVNVGREALQSAIRRVSLLSSERGRAVKLGLDDGKLELTRVVAGVRRGARVAAGRVQGRGASRSASTRSTCSTSWASWAASRWRSSSRTRESQGLLRPVERRRRRLPLRRHADAVLEDVTREALVWVEQLRVRDLRNIREAALELGPGLNVFFGKNAQGKTSLLEAVGVVARGRSFRTEDAPSVIRRGARARSPAAAAAEDERQSELEVELRPGQRVFRVDGREVRPAGVPRAARRGRVLERAAARRARHDARPPAVPRPPGGGAVARLPRRAPRSSSACSPSATPPSRRAARDHDAWTERFVEAGARLRSRRARLREPAQRRARHGLPAGGRDATRCASSPRRPRARRRAAARSPRSSDARGARARAPAAAWPGRTATPSRCCSTATTPATAPRPARRGACCWRWPSPPARSTARRRAARRWRCSTISIPSSTRSERCALCAEVARRGQASSRARTPAGRRACGRSGASTTSRTGAVRCA